MYRSKVQLVATSTRDKTAHDTKQMLSDESDVRQADTCAVAMLIHVRACFLSLVFCVCCLYFAGVS